MYLSASESPTCAREGFEGAFAASANSRKVIFLTFSAILPEFDKRLVKPGFKREVIIPLLFTEEKKKGVLKERHQRAEKKKRLAL